MVPNLGSYKDQNWPLKNKEWAAMVTWLDQCVGDIVALLRELKLEENTLIIFASDNGYSQWMYLNRPHWEDDPIFKNKGPWPGGKFAVDEGGCRVPMVAYWPKHIRPGESRSLVSFYDFMPTLTELAGVSCPPTDGISLVPEWESLAEYRAVAEDCEGVYGRQRGSGRLLRRPGIGQGIFSLSWKTQASLESRRLGWF